MLRVQCLGSGSKGNGLLVQAGDVLMLWDCGFSLKELTRRMQSIDLHPEQLAAVLVTHEHQDHSKGVGPLARRYGTPVWMSHGTLRGCRDSDFPELHLFHPHGQTLDIQGVSVTPFPVPHDALETTQFKVAYQGHRFASLTDLGWITPHVASVVADCDALLLECNHDPDMLKNGPYPPSLQARVRSRVGHLGNDVAASYLAGRDLSRVNWILLGHLSEQNNHPDLVSEAVNLVAPDFSERFHILDQYHPSGWYEVTARADA